MLDLRAFMFERVYLGPRRRSSERSPSPPYTGSSTDWSPTRTSCRRTGPATCRTDRRLRVGHDRPLRARMAIIAQTSIDQVKAAADMVEIVGARTQLEKVGARWTDGRCPFHEERTPSFSVNAADKLFYCFGCGMKERPDHVREGDRGLDFVGAIEWLSERYRIPLAYERRRPREAGGKAQRRRSPLCCPSSSRRRPCTSATSGSRPRARRRATTSLVAASVRRCAARTASASRRAEPCSLRKLGRRASSRTSWSPRDSSTGVGTTTTAW